MTTQTQARGTRTARKRAAAPVQKRAAAPERRAAAQKRTAAPQEPPPPAPVPLREETAEEETVQQKRTEAAPGPNRGRRITLPVIGARIPLPAPPTRLPDPAHLLWLGGLAGTAALGVVEWPVAAALAAGTWMIERFAKASVREELRHAGVHRE